MTFFFFFPLLPELERLRSLRARHGHWLESVIFKGGLASDIGKAIGEVGGRYPSLDVDGERRNNNDAFDDNNNSNDDDTRDRNNNTGGGGIGSEGREGSSKVGSGGDATPIRVRRASSLRGQRRRGQSSDGTDASSNANAAAAAAATSTAATAAGEVETGSSRDHHRQHQGHRHRHRHRDRQRDRQRRRQMERRRRRRGGAGAGAGELQQRLRDERLWMTMERDFLVNVVSGQESSDGGVFVGFLHSRLYRKVDSDAPSWPLARGCADPRKLMPRAALQVERSFLSSLLWHTGLVRNAMAVSWILSQAQQRQQAAEAATAAATTTTAAATGDNNSNSNSNSNSTGSTSSGAVDFKALMTAMDKATVLRLGQYMSPLSQVVELSFSAGKRFNEKTGSESKNWNRWVMHTAGIRREYDANRPGVPPQPQVGLFSLLSSLFSLLFLLLSFSFYSILFRFRRHRKHKHINTNINTTLLLRYHVITSSPGPRVLRAVEAPTEPFARSCPVRSHRRGVRSG